MRVFGVPGGAFVLAGGVEAGAVADGDVKEGGGGRIVRAVVGDEEEEGEAGGAVGAAEVEGDLFAGGGRSWRWGRIRRGWG